MGTTRLLHAFAALACAAGCGLEAASGPAALDRELLVMQVATLSFTRTELLDIAAEELEGRRIRFVMDDDGIDIGLLPDIEYGRTEFESVASDYLDAVHDRLAAGGLIDSTSFAMLAERVMPELADDGPMLAQIEAILVPWLSVFFGELDADGEVRDCNKVRLDDVGAVSVSFANVSLERSGTDLSLRFDLENLLVEVRHARAWVPTLWCNVFTIDGLDIRYPGTVLTATLDAKVDNRAQPFAWPKAWAACRDIAPQSLFYPEGLPSESSAAPGGLDYATVTVSTSWLAGDLSSPELDFDNPVTDAVVALVSGVGGVLGGAAGALGCVFDEVFGDGSACDAELPEAFEPAPLSIALKFTHFAIQNVRAGSLGILFDYTVDEDWDGVLTGLDNCPSVSNRAQGDADFDGVGDACDPEVMSVSEAEMAAALAYFVDWAYIALCLGDLVHGDLPEYLGADDIFSLLDDPALIGRPEDGLLPPGLLGDLMGGYLDRWRETYVGGPGPIMERPESYIDRHAAIDLARGQVADLAARIGRPGLLRLDFAARIGSGGVERLAIIDPVGVMRHLTAAELITLRTAAAPIAVRPLGNNAGATAGEPMPHVTGGAPEVAAEPNPFNPRVAIRFLLPRAGGVTLDVVDLRGRRVRSLLSGSLPAGEHTVTWTGVDDRGRRLPSGVYVAVVRSDAGTATHKLTMLQ